MALNTKAPTPSVGTTNVPEPSVDVTQTYRWMTMNNNFASREGVVVMNNIRVIVVYVQKMPRGLQAEAYLGIQGP